MYLRYMLIRNYSRTVSSIILGHDSGHRSTWRTLDHLFASLAGGGPAEDMLLETVVLDWPQLGLRLGLGLGGQGRGTDGR